MKKGKKKTNQQPNPLDQTTQPAEPRTSPPPVSQQRPPRNAKALLPFASPAPGFLAEVGRLWHGIPLGPGQVNSSGCVPSQPLAHTLPPCWRGKVGGKKRQILMLCVWCKPTGQQRTTAGICALPPAPVAWGGGNTTKRSKDREGSLTSRGHRQRPHCPRGNKISLIQTANHRQQTNCPAAGQGDTDGSEQPLPPALPSPQAQLCSQSSTCCPRAGQGQRTGAAASLPSLVSGASSSGAGELPILRGDVV